MFLITSAGQVPVVRSLTVQWSMQGEQLLSTALGSSEEFVAQDLGVGFMCSFIFGRFWGARGGEAERAARESGEKFVQFFLNFFPDFVASYCSVLGLRPVVVVCGVGVIVVVNNLLLNDLLVFLILFLPFLFLLLFLRDSFCLFACLFWADNGCYVSKRGYQTEA